MMFLLMLNWFLFINRKQSFYLYLSMRKLDQQLNYTPKIWKCISITYSFTIKGYIQSVLFLRIGSDVPVIFLILWHLIKHITEFMQYTVAHRFIKSFRLRHNCCSFNNCNALFSLSSKTRIASKDLRWSVKAFAFTFLYSWRKSL